MLETVNSRINLKESIKYYIYICHSTYMFLLTDSEKFELHTLPCTADLNIISCLLANNCHAFLQSLPT